MIDTILTAERRIGWNYRVKARVWNQISLQLFEVCVQNPIESHGRSHRRGNLGNQSVDVDVVGILYSQLPLASFVERLIVKGKGYVLVL